MKPFSVQLPVSIFREGKSFVAYTPSLDISTCGSTLAETKKRFSEIVEIFFEELDLNGTTKEVLESLGWEKLDHSWSPPLEVSHSIESFDLHARA